MKKKPLILRATIAALSAATISVPSLFAATLDNFTAGDPTNTFATPTTAGQNSGPSIIADPSNPANSILHLLNGEGSQNNHYTYDLSDPGAFETINASFDFRITTGSNGLADGLGFILIPTSTFGTTGDGPNPTAEEPNVLGAFGLGIDVFDQINNVSTHWNGFQVNELNTAFTTSFRDNGVFNRVQITLQRLGNATNATVSLITDSLGVVPGASVKVMETVIPNMLPYENRVHLGGRTGGQNMNLDLDNVNVTYANPFLGGLPVAPTGHLYQDFDSSGTTGYRAVQVTPTNSTAIFRPGPLIKAAEAGTTGAFLRIVNDAIEGQNNRIVFDRAIDAGATNMGEALQFDVRFNSTDAPADGLGLLFLRTRDPGTGASNFANDGVNSNPPEEPNHANMLGIGFDVFDNDGAGTADTAPGISLHWNGSKLQDLPLPAEFAISQFHRVQVLREPVVNGTTPGLNVTVTATPNINGAPGAPITLIDHFFVPGAMNYDYRVQMSGRTGGLNADHDIDNIIASQIARPQLANTQANFTEASGSGWKGYAFGAGAAPDIRNEFGLNGNFLRLTHDTVNGQINAVAFDKQLDGTVAGKTGIVGSFNFRMRSPTDQPADGLSMMLIPTATYGNTGAGVTATPGFVPEEPNAAGTFGIGLDIFEGSLANQVSIHWDGVPVTQVDVDPLAINLTSGGFHRLQLELTQDAGGMLLDLILTSDIFGLPGTPVVVANDLLIPGMNIYDYRLEIAARTGGLNMTVDLDDILFQTVPEPGSAALLGLGALLLARRRRRV